MSMASAKLILGVGPAVSLVAVGELAVPAPQANVAAAGFSVVANLLARCTILFTAHPRA
jgi:hypothetical protein